MVSLGAKGLAYVDGDRFMLAQLAVEQPRMTGGLVKLPILMDDWDLYRSGMDYARWEEEHAVEVE